MPIIHPPTVDEQVGRGLAYFFVAAVGASVLVWPLPSIAAHGITIVSVAWAVAMLAAIPAALGTVTGRYRVEYSALPCFTIALLVAVTATWINVIFVTYDTTVVPRACASTALTLLLVVRWRQLHRLIKVLEWTQQRHKP